MNLAECRVEPLRAQDDFAQEDHAKGGFEIADRMAIGEGDRVRARHDRRRLRVGDEGGDLVGGRALARRVLLVALGPEDAALEGVGFIDIDEGVEALVHPRIAPLVGADEHGKVSVPDLVHRDPEELLALVRGTVEEQRGVLHAADGSPHVDGVGPGIGEPAPGKILDREFEILGRPSPAIVTRARRGIERLSQRRLAVGQVDARGIPEKSAGGGKRHVARLVHVEAPGLRPLRRPGGGHIFGAADRDGLVARARRGQAASFRWGEHVPGIHQNARAGDDHVGRHGDGVVKVAIFQVELVAEIR